MDENAMSSLTTPEIIEKLHELSWVHVFLHGQQAVRVLTCALVYGVAFVVGLVLTLKGTIHPFLYIIAMLGLDVVCHAVYLWWTMSCRMWLREVHADLLAYRAERERRIKALG